MYLTVESGVTSFVCSGSGSAQTRVRFTETSVSHFYSHRVAQIVPVAP